MSDDDREIVFLPHYEMIGPELPPVRPLRDGGEACYKFSDRTFARRIMRYTGDSKRVFTYEEALVQVRRWGGSLYPCLAGDHYHHTSLLDDPLSQPDRARLLDDLG